MLPLRSLLSECASQGTALRRARVSSPAVSQFVSDLVALGHAGMPARMCTLHTQRGATAPSPAELAAARLRAGGQQQRRGFHTSASHGVKRRVPLEPGMLPDTRMFPPSAEGAAEALLEARRSIFGMVQGDNQRSGRKVMRAKLAGATVKGWYEPKLTDFGLERVGVENPVREELFRAEEEKNRIGKTRIKGKMRGTTPEFLRVMALGEAEEEAFEPVDVFAPEDALPDERTLGILADGLDDQEEAWLRELLGSVAASAEEEMVVSEGGKAKGTLSKEEKRAQARRVRFRQGMDDKRLKPEGPGFGQGEDDGDAGAAAGPSLAAEAEPEAGSAGGSSVRESERALLAEVKKTLAGLAAQPDLGPVNDSRIRKRAGAR